MYLLNKKHFLSFLISRSFLVVLTTYLVACAPTKTHTDPQMNSKSNATSHRRPIQGISESFFKKMKEVSDLLSPDYATLGYVEPDYVLAKAKLKDMELFCETSCNEYEKSHIYLYYAYIFYQEGDLQVSKDMNDRVVTFSPKIPVATELNALVLSAAIEYRLGRPQEVKPYLEKIKALSPKRYQELTSLRAVVLHYEEKYDEALKLVDISISKSGKPLNSKELYQLKLDILNKVDMGGMKAVVEEKIAELEKPNGDYLPIVKVAPSYPKQAILDNIQGFCTVEYTVLTNGKTTDLKVVECSNEIFIETSLKTAAKFVYKPKEVDGERVEVPGVRNRFIFEIKQ